MENVKYVNRTGENLANVMSVFREAYETGKINPDFEDVFKIEMLKGYNPDKSDRMLIDLA